MVASNIDTARAIVTSLIASIEGPILWDVVFTDPSRHQLATDLGFRPLRDLTRMFMVAIICSQRWICSGPSAIGLGLDELTKADTHK